METGERICGRCKKIKNKDVSLIEKHDMLVCPECGTSIIVKGKYPLGRYVETWKKNAEEVFPLVRPPFIQNDISSIRLFFLYEDCYHSVLIGRYNAAIVLMGVLLEASMKELILLKTGKHFQKAYGKCIEKIRKEKLMDAWDIWFLKRFKDEVRNPYQHSDINKILQPLKFMRAYPLQIDLKKDTALLQLEQQIKNVKEGKMTPVLLPITLPTVRDLAKQDHDKKRAIQLFNQVYDFLLCANFKYFKQKDYDEHHKKFGKINKV